MFLYRFTYVFVALILTLFVAACGGESTPAPVDTATPAAATASATPATPAEPTQSSQPASPLSAPVSPLAAPAFDAPSAGKAAIAGRLIDIKTGLMMADQNLSLPAVLCAPGVAEADKREQCFYMIDEAFDPSTLTDGEGRFIFQDIPAGEYVLMVGNLMTEYTVLTDELNQPLIWKADANNVLDVGDIVVDFE